MPDTDDLKRRLGKVKVNEVLMWDVKAMNAMFTGTILLDIQSWDFNRVRVYTIACPEFDRLQDGEQIPEYRAWIRNNSGTHTRENWEKV